MKGKTENAQPLGEELPTEEEPPVITEEKSETDDLEEVVMRVRKPKPKPKPKKPVVIYEESDSSESEDDNSNVVYIKKKSKYKKAAPEPPPPQPAPRREVVMNPNPLFRHNYLQQYHM